MEEKRGKVAKKRKLVVTAKDEELLNLFDDWGYLTVDELMLFMGLAKQSIVWRVKRLVELKLLKRSFEPIGTYVYFVKTNGFNLQNYEHEHACKQAMQTLKTKLQCEAVDSKRIKGELIKSKGVQFLGVKVPDLLLVKDHQKIAIEIELNQKQTQRQKENLIKYRDDLALGLYVQVVYYCKTDAIKNRIDILLETLKMEGIKSNLLSSITF